MNDLFANIEVNSEPRWPVLLRLIAASLCLHMMFLASVVYVPALRDAFNIASMIASTSVVDKPYAATQISDEVELLELTGEKFHYPEGYFSLEASQSAQKGVAQADPFAPKIISQAQVERPKPAGAPSPSPEPTPVPSPSPAVNASPSVAITQEQNVANANANTNLTPDEAQKELEKTAAKNNIELPEENQINKKALKDFAEYATQLK